MLYILYLLWVKNSYRYISSSHIRVDNTSSKFERDSVGKNQFLTPFLVKKIVILLKS